MMRMLEFIRRIDVVKEEYKNLSGVAPCHVLNLLCYMDEYFRGLVMPEKKSGSLQMSLKTILNFTDSHRYLLIGCR